MMQDEKELDPTSTKIELLKEIIEYMKGGVADEMHSRHNPAPPPVEEAEVLEGSPEVAIDGAPEGGEEDVLGGLDEETLAKLLGG